MCLLRSRKRNFTFQPHFPPKRPWNFAPDWRWIDNAEDWLKSDTARILFRRLLVREITRLKSQILHWEKLGVGVKRLMVWLNDATMYLYYPFSGNELLTFIERTTKQWAHWSCVLCELTYNAYGPRLVTKTCFKITHQLVSIPFSSMFEWNEWMKVQWFKVHSKAKCRLSLVWVISEPCYTWSSVHTCLSWFSN